MKNLKEKFIKLAFESGALKFGQFKLKSGRISPYFFNAGLINRGPGLYLLGQLYANALISSQTDFEHLFGPAYKGFPLATATGIALAEMGMDISVTFNRKEAKSIFKATSAFLLIMQPTNLHGRPVSMISCDSLCSFFTSQ